ncbi:MAG: acyl-CoA dehydrogenase family protein [Burkholderiaceae bacterium]
MDLSFSPEDQAFRQEVRSWLEANIPAESRRKMQDAEELTKDDLVQWHKILAKKGWIAPHWPPEWGGTDWTPAQKHIFDEEYGLAAAPPIAPFGPTMCGSVLLRFGTEEQKKRFLPRIYNCDDFWVQGYSEPGSGSDLASLKCRADRDGDHYVINGQKIWTTLGHYGDWIFCLVRTDFDTAKRQDGISFVLVDMKTPGITVRPLILLDEGHEVNEVFFENVRVPVENLVYEENKGWTVAKYLLGFERLNTGRIGASKRELRKLKELAAKATRQGRPLMDDVRFRDRLTRIEVELMALEVTNLRFIDEMQRTGQPPGPDVSMLKIKGTEIQQALTEMMMMVVGTRSQSFKPIDHPDFDRKAAKAAPKYFNYRKTSIYAGSNEIQRNIIAKMSLGL